jgi:MFS family permease
LPLNSAVIAISGTLSGLLGGWLAELLKDWRLPIHGWNLTFHVVLFVLSALLRIVALVWVLGLKDERRRPVSSLTLARKHQPAPQSTVAVIPDDK